MKLRHVLQLLPVFVASATMPPAFAADEVLGRLFFSADRRATLDRLRASNIEEQQVSQLDVLTVDGLVRRSSGRSTAWVNGVPITEKGQGGLNALPDPRHSGVVRVVPQDQPGASITVGTGINRSTGERLDPMSGGFVGKGPVPPRAP